MQISQAKAWHASSTTKLGAVLRLLSLRASNEQTSCIALRALPSLQRLDRWDAPGLELVSPSITCIRLTISGSDKVAELPSLVACQSLSHSLLRKHALRIQDKLMLEARGETYCPTEGLHSS